MARGGRTNLAALAGAVGEQSPVERPEANRGPWSSVKLADLVANPRNPRDDLGDLSDLASIADRQLQPALVVTRSAYLKLYPEDADELGEAKWVVINGCRRLAAAEKWGCKTLDIVINDDVASDGVTLLSAAVIENIGRRDFDVIEEAKAVALLVEECGGTTAAAERLSMTKGWVSQRCALIKLAPELQTALRRGELAIRVARSLAQVPHEQQVAAWRTEQSEDADKPGAEKKPRPDQPVAADAAHVAKTFRRLNADPSTIAEALREYLDDEGMQALREALSAMR